MDFGFFENTGAGGVLSDVGDFFKDIFVAREARRTEQVRQQTANQAAAALQRDATERFKIMAMILAAGGLAFLVLRES